MMPVAIDGDRKAGDPHKRMWYALAPQTVPDSQDTYRRVGIITASLEDGRSGVVESTKCIVAKWLLSGTLKQLHLIYDRAYTSREI
jgi:hypothetical protein